MPQQEQKVIEGFQLPGSDIIYTFPKIFGPQGVSITSVEQTTTSSEDKGINQITVTLSDGKTSTFNIQNGSKGSQGTAAKIGQVTASVDNAVGIPSVEVVTGGSDTAKTFQFQFSNLKGETGAAAGFEAVTASADNLHLEEPTVTVTSGGTNAAKTFDFKFSGLKGEPGIKGDPGTNGQDGFAPTVSIAVVEEGTKIIITDATGSHEAIIPNGKDGAAGKDGQSYMQYTATLDLTFNGLTTCTVSTGLDNLTADSELIVTPVQTLDNVKKFNTAIIYCQSQGANTLTFGCETPPEGTVQVKVFYGDIIKGAI